MHELTGASIRAERNQRGWTQEELAEAAKVGARTIQRIEGEDRYSPTTIRLVATALGLELPIPPRESPPGASTTTGCLPRVGTGRGLVELVGGADARDLRHPNASTEEEVVLLSELLQYLADLCDVWEALGPGEIVREAFHLQAELDSLAGAGFWVFGQRVVRPFRFGLGESCEVLSLTVAVIAVERADDPRITLGPSSEHRPSFA